MQIRSDCEHKCKQELSETTKVVGVDALVIRTKGLIPISSIAMDRYPLNPSTLSLIEYLKKGGEVPPIKVAKLKNGNYRILDGRHRVTASKLLGRKLILGKVSMQPLRLYNYCIMR